MGVYTYPVNHPKNMVNRRKNSRSRKKMRLNIFLRSLVVGCTVVVLLSFGLYAWSHRSNSVKQQSLVYEPVVVSSGDTLWNLADETGIAQDKRMLIFQIMDYNDLVTSTIYPGQVIYIPKTTH